MERNLDTFKDTFDPETIIKRLKDELQAAQRESIDAAKIKDAIGGINKQLSVLSLPKWVVQEPKKRKSPGVPTLFLSDLHWGEIVHPTQINNVNSYNLNVARQRLQNCILTAINLLRILDNDLNYPGIVVPLGGDCISGNLHEELTASNEINSMPSVLDLFSHLAAAILLLADTFGAVFLPCVTGNHGRDTKKTWAKDRHHTSFDWLLYRFLAKHFELDKRITFFIPDGSDALFSIFGTRFNLTHGDQFKSSDSIIGPIGPIFRGDQKKRSRNAQVDLAYDLLILGHWHTYIHTSRVIVNGSIKGMDEYAFQGNFGFEPPQQALWITHPQHGITFRMPVYCDPTSKPEKTQWVSHIAGATKSL